MHPGRGGRRACGAARQTGRRLPAARPARAVAWALAQARAGRAAATCRRPAARCPARMSRHRRASCATRGLLAGHITAGPAYGGEQRGDHDARRDPRRPRAEAGTPRSSGPGPGILGSGSALGHGGMVALDSAHAALALGCPTVVVARACPPATRASATAASRTTRGRSSSCCSRPCAGRRCPDGAGPADAEARAPRAAPRGAVDLDGYRASGLPRARWAATSTRTALLRRGARGRRRAGDMIARVSTTRFERVGCESVWTGEIAHVRVERFRHDDGEEVDARDRRPPRRGRDRRRTTTTHVWLVRQPRETVGEPDAAGDPRRQARRGGRGRRCDTAKRELAEEIGKARRALGAPEDFYIERRLHRRGDPRLPGHRPPRLRGRAGRGRRAHRVVPWPLERLDDAIAPCHDAKSLIGLLELRAAALAADRSAAHGGPAAPRAKRSLDMATAAAPLDARPYEDLVLDFLAYLEFERGLSRNTLEAYRSDLLQFGALARAHRRDGADRRARRPRRLRRRARRRPEGRRRPDHAAAQGRVPALLLPPPAPRGPARPRPDRRPEARRRAPEAAAGAHPRRGRAACSRSRRGPSPRRCATARCWSSCTPAACAPPRRPALELRDVDLDAGRPARQRQGLQGAHRARSAARRSRRVRAYARARAAGARRPARRAAPVRQPARGRTDPPGPLQDRPAPRAQRRTARTR